MRTKRLGFALGAAAFIACSGSDRDGFGVGPGGPGGPGADGGGFFGEGGSEGGDPPAGCAPNPGNYDFPGNRCDDDADGTVDNPPACDGDLAEQGAAEDFARAIGLCAKASDKGGWGLVSAKYTRGYKLDAPANDGQHGILPKFGDVVRPREGKRLGVLSTGYAGEFNGAPNKGFGGEFDYQNWEQDGAVPKGYPKEATGCPGSPRARDQINVKLEIKAPRNANGLKFDFNYYSSEWPKYICTLYNDSFIAYLEAKGFNGGIPENISFDAKKNPVSVNNGFFDRCTSGVPTGCGFYPKPGPASVCPGGPTELGGTGFAIQGEGCEALRNVPLGGATGWLTSQAPVEAGETFTLEFMIWDTADGTLDSSVLLDNFTWSEKPVPTETTRPPR